MLIYIISAIFIVIYTIVYDINKSKKRKIVFLTIAFGILTIIAALRKYTVGTDLEIIYKPIFDNIKSTNIVSLKDINIEIGFGYILKILSYLSSNVQIVTISTSIFIYLSYAIFIYKNSDDVGMSTILFILLSTYLMSMNIIRQQVAIALILYFFDWFKNKKYVRFIAILLLATTIHSSAIICLILIPLGNIKFKKQHVIYSFFIILFAMIFLAPLVENFSEILSLGSNNKNYASYLINERHGRGYINMSSISEFLVAFVLYIIIVYYYSLIKKENQVISNNEQREDNIILFSAMLYFLFVTSTFKMNVMSRLGYYFLPILLISVPKAIAKSNINNNKKIIKFGLYIGLFAKYLMVVFVLADTLYGVTPYKFFWQ